MKRITIEPVSRIEGHAKITLKTNGAGGVEEAFFHVTQVRGFEKFCEGRPFYEMPSITARIWGGAVCAASRTAWSNRSIRATRCSTWWT